jgi:hypothetical protein
MEEPQRAAEDTTDSPAATNDTVPRPIAKPFRFKKRSRSPEDSANNSSAQSSASTKRHKSSHQASTSTRRHKHHHRSSKHADASARSSPPRSPSLSPDSAFRASLFDALADEEGAQYWEGVYGQPIHVYPQNVPTSNATHGATNNGSTPPLETLDEEVYVAWVRSKMWEKSHAHILEERARRDAERERERIRRREEGRKLREEQEKWRKETTEGQRDFEARFQWDRGIDDALRRRRGRKEDKEWKGAWERYVRGWQGLLNCVMEKGKEKGKEKEKARAGDDDIDGHASDTSGTSKTSSRASARSSEGSWQLLKVPWPVASGRAADVTASAVEAFFRNAPPSQFTAPFSSGSTIPAPDLVTILKAERVRWHPDKIQQRFGGVTVVDEATLKAVTAVFQIVDRLWGEEKARAGSGHAMYGHGGGSGSGTGSANRNANHGGSAHRSAATNASSSSRANEESWGFGYEEDC